MGLISTRDLLERKFETYKFDGEWLASFGEPETNFRCIIYGNSGNGKTEFCVKLAKYLSKFKKVYYNSYEQGVCKSLQDAALRNNMGEVLGRVMWGNRDDFQTMMGHLGKKNAPQILIIDSANYMNMTQAQYKELVSKHPRKTIIIVSQESNGKPKGEHCKAIEYMVDVKIRVVSFKAHMRSRFGGNEPFVIWDKGVSRPQQGTLFNNVT